MANNLKRMMKRFGEEVGKLTFVDPVAYVYNPLDYAWAGQEAFIDKFFRGRPEGEEHLDDPEPRPTMLVGMNPGPYGMTQSGVPFGAPKLVQSWMGIDLPPDAIRPPPVVCPARPIFGFSPVPITSTPTPTRSKGGKDTVSGKKRKRAPPRQPSLREEVSGKRIYVDWAMNTYPSAEAFFKEFYIHPYCPMQFMATTGTNLTPDELHKSDRVELYDVCDRYLREAIQLLRPKRVIGIGNFADERIRDTLKRWRQEEGEEEGTDRDQELLEQLVVGKIPHPSPRSPLARVMWGNRAAKINELLRGFGVDVPYTVPELAEVAAADDQVGELNVEAEMDKEKEEEEAETKSKHTHKRSKAAKRGAATGRTRDLPITKRRRRHEHAK